MDSATTPVNPWQRQNTASSPPTFTTITTTCISSTASPRPTRATTSSGRRRKTSLSNLESGTPLSPSQTAQPHHSGIGGSSSNGGIGPSPTTSAGTNGGHPVQQGRSFHLTPAETKAVIACSVIGAAFIFALIIFLLWRRRRRKQADPLTLAMERSPSQTTFLTTKTRDAGLTALPMHRDRRKAAAAGRDPVVQDSLSQGRPVGQDLWKSANPPTPTHSTFGRYVRNIPNSSLLKPPEMALAAGTSLFRPKIRVSSHDDTFYTPAESIHAPSTIDLEGKSYSGSPPSSQSATKNRWSMATSFATTKSRLSGAAVANFPGIQGVKGWMSGQAGEQDGQAGPSGTNSRVLLKNKATKPNLAPVPTRELSRRSLFGGSWKKGESVESVENVDVGDAIPDDGVVS